MSGKDLFFSALFFLSFIVAKSQDVHSGNSLDLFTEAFVQPGINNNASSAPYVESILNNPAVSKKQLSRHTIQAIGQKRDQVHFVVHFYKAKLHGEWKSFYGDDQICDSGYFKKGLPDGEWKTWYANGKVKTIRNYSADKYHYIKADLNRNHPRNQKYKLTKLAQQRKETSPYFQPDYNGQPQNTTYLNLLDKIHYNTQNNDNRYTAPFTNCIHHGFYMNYFENGAVKDSGYFENGLKHGVWKETSTENNILAIGFYDHGLKSGQWKYYNASEQLLYTDLYSKEGKKERHHFK